MPGARVSLDVVEIQDWIGLVQLDAHLGSARHRAGDVQALVAIIEKDARLNDVAFVDAVDPPGVISHRGRNAARVRVRIIWKRQLRHVWITLDARRHLKHRRMDGNWSSGAGWDSRAGSA